MKHIDKDGTQKTVSFRLDKDDELIALVDALKKANHEKGQFFGGKP